MSRGSLDVGPVSSQHSSTRSPGARTWTIQVQVNVVPSDVVTVMVTS